MNILGLIVIAVGLIFLTYSIVAKNKVNIYNRSEKYIIVDMNNFLVLQFWVSIFNSLFMIIFGVIVVVKDLPGTYVIAYTLFFQFMNYLTILIGRAKQYIKYS